MDASLVVTMEWIDKDLMWPPPSDSPSSASSEPDSSSTTSSTTTSTFNSTSATSSTPSDPSENDTTQNNSDNQNSKGRGFVLITDCYLQWYFTDCPLFCADFLKTENLWNEQVKKWVICGYFCNFKVFIKTLRTF